MNEETIRRMIREEIETTLKENADILVDYRRFSQVVNRVMASVGIKGFNNDPVRRCYDNLKQEIGQLGAMDQHELPQLVRFYTHDMAIDMLATSRVPEDQWETIADRVVDYLVGEVSD